MGNVWGEVFPKKPKVPTHGQIYASHTAEIAADATTNLVA